MSNVDLRFLISFLREHCTPGACNPLSLLSAAQLVRDLPADQVALFQEALEGVVLDASLTALIADKLTYRESVNTVH